MNKEQLELLSESELLKYIHSFERIKDIKFDEQHLITDIYVKLWVDEETDNQNTITTSICILSVFNMEIILLNEYTDESCDFSYTSSFKKVISITYK
jgi:hypothetical protein